MEMLMATYLVGINFVSFTMHTGDKAISKGWLPFLGRIPESVLHQVELAGGSPGAFLAQRVLRHKISKLPYQRGFSQILIIQIAASVACGYFQGPSWALAGAGLAPAVMLAVTARRMSTLKDREHRRNNGGGYGNRGHPPWQRPVDASAPANTRRNTRSKGGVPYK